MSIIFIIGRIIFGGYFIYSSFGHFFGIKGLASFAASKGIPMPKLAVLISGALLFLGGLGIITWFAVKIALLCLVVFFVFVTPTMHAFWKDTDSMVKMNNKIQFTKNIAILGAIIIMLSSFF
jgi:uncharacterized membrane protein YphA (DoxX/SURF4 family)